MGNHRAKQSFQGNFLKNRLLSTLAIAASLMILVLAACGDASPTSQGIPTTAPATTVPATTAAPTTAAPVTVPTTTSPVTPATNGGFNGGSASTPGGTPLAEVPDEIKKPFALITTDLEKRSGLAASSFQITGYSEETFPNSALGCPDPDMMYAQVLTPGYRIQVSAGGKSYDYRTNQAGTRILLCIGGRPAPTP